MRWMSNEMDVKWDGCQMRWMSNEMDVKWDGCQMKWMSNEIGVVNRKRDWSARTVRAVCKLCCPTLVQQGRKTVVRLCELRTEEEARGYERIGALGGNAYFEVRWWMRREISAWEMESKIKRSQIRHLYVYLKLAQRTLEVVILQKQIVVFSWRRCKSWKVWQKWPDRG